MNPTIKLECANCGATQDVPENPSVERVLSMTEEFFNEHREPDCKEKSIFIRTFSV